MPGQPRGLATRSAGRRPSAPGTDDVVALASRRELSVARQVRARELVSGTPPDGIAAQIRSECGTTMIRAYRLALGIALADVVAQVRAWYQAEGRKPPRFSETLLSAYESGQKRPGPEYLHYLCAVYRADPHDLGYPGGCRCGGRHGTAAPPVTAAAAPVPGGAGQGPGSDGHGPGGDGQGPGGDHDEDLIRRAVLRLRAGPGGDAPGDEDSAFFGAADRIRRRMDDALFAGKVSETMIDRWEQATAAYGREYLIAPPLRLLGDTLLDVSDVRRMCAERQPAESAERLCRLAGRLAGLAGIIMINLGDPRLARSFFRTARIAADETADRRLRAWVAAREALVPLYYGDPGEALALANSAADLAGHQPSVAGVMAPAIAARAMARMAGYGSRRALDQARDLLDRAHDAVDDLPASDRADTAFGYTQRQLFFHEGDALLALGDGQRAARSFARALSGYRPGEFLDRSLIVLGQARCLLEAGEPEQALRLSQNALLGLDREHRPEIVLRAARLLGRLVAARHAGLPAVREYREALLTG
jgi:tetratricopeptide (TPR) repeat protein